MSLSAHSAPVARMAQEPERGNPASRKRSSKFSEGQMSAHEYQSKEPIPGTQYKFVQKIGEGGFGCVFVVEHGYLERKYVMKLLHAHLIDREDIATRMHQE